MSIRIANPVHASQDSHFEVHNNTKIGHHNSLESKNPNVSAALERKDSSSMQDFYESGKIRAQQGVTAKNMIDLNNISVWDFFENVSKTDSMEDHYKRSNRFGGSLGMAVSVRVPSESHRGRHSKSGNHPVGSSQLHELFKNEMINVNVLPKIKADT